MGCNESKSKESNSGGNNNAKLGSSTSRREPVLDEHHEEYNTDDSVNSSARTVTDDEVVTSASCSENNTLSTTASDNHHSHHEDCDDRKVGSSNSTLVTSSSPFTSHHSSVDRKRSVAGGDRSASSTGTGGGGGLAGLYAGGSSPKKNIIEADDHSNYSTKKQSPGVVPAAAVVAAVPTPLPPRREQPPASAVEDESEEKQKKKPTHLFQCLPQLIGRGGTASVFLGSMKENTEGAKAMPVAVKTVEISDPKQLQIIQSEYETLSKLSGCNQIVRVFHFEQQGKKGRIYMELVRKGSLRSVVKKCPQRRLHELVIRTYLKDALKGLVFLHKKGIIHRDLKPENMLVWDKYELPFSSVDAALKEVITEEGDEHPSSTTTKTNPFSSSDVFNANNTQDCFVKITDFGTSKYTLHGICATTVNVVGTVPYMSQECIKGKFSEASDVWAWAVSFLELATRGQMVWSQFNCKDSYGLLLKIGMLQSPNHHPPIEGGVTELSAAARSLLQRCFAFQYEDRPSAQELLDDYYFNLSPEEFMDLEGMEDIEHYCKDIEVQ